MMALDNVYSVTNLLYTFVVALIIATITLKWYRERKCPPGPIGLPWIGYVLFLGKKPHVKLRDLGRKYGDVFSLYMGPYLNICVNDYAVAKELLCDNTLLHRPEQFTSFLPGKGGLAGMNGLEWQEQRRFAFYTMRNLGLGKGLWETMVQEAVAEFTEDLKSLKGKPKNLEEVIGTFHASNVISLLLGRHLDKEKDAEEIEIIQTSIKAFMKYMGVVAITGILPRLGKFLKVFRLCGYHKFEYHLRKFEGIFRKEVEKRMRLPESIEVDDYIGCFLREMKKREETGIENHTFLSENLIGNLVILFISSNESTKASISWLFLYMIAYPDVQKKIHDEIDSVVGRDGIIYFDVKTKFPYTMATIFEVIRCVSISPMTMPRRVTEDMTINGYSVPKGSLIFINLWAIMHDPKYFKDPMEFKPERFLSGEDKVVKNIEGYLPFSIGKRNCPGEGIAIMTAFLYFTSFMQKFKVTMPPGKKVDLEPMLSAGGNVYKPQEICFLER